MPCYVDLEIFSFIRSRGSSFNVHLQLVNYAAKMIIQVLGVLYAAIYAAIICTNSQPRPVQRQLRGYSISPESAHNQLAEEQEEANGTPEPQGNCPL